MKKLLVLLFSLMLSFNSYANPNYNDIDYSLSEFCESDPKVQYRNNYSQIFLPNEDKGISATSLCVYKDGYGQYKSKGEYVNGKKIGKHLAWYRNGQKSFEAFFINGKSEGKWLNWFDDGKKRFESNSIGGKLDGKSISWNRGGGILKEHFYEAGLKQGKAFLSSIGYFVEGSYKDGKPDGRWTWYSGGDLWKEGLFSEGKLLRCNILIDSNDFDESTFENRIIKALFEKSQEENPGCDIETVKILTPYFMDGEWI